MHVKIGKVYRVVIASTKVEHEIIFLTDELYRATRTVVGRGIWVDNVPLELNANHTIDAVLDDSVYAYLYIEDERTQALLEQGKIIGTVPKILCRKVLQVDGKLSPVGLRFDGVIMVSQDSTIQKDAVLPSSDPWTQFFIQMNGPQMPPPEGVEFGPSLPTEVKAYMKAGRVIEYYCLVHDAWVTRERHGSCSFLPDLSRRGGYYSVSLYETVSKFPNSNVIYNMLEALLKGEKLSQYKLRVKTGLAAQTVEQYRKFMQEKGLVVVTTEPHRGAVEQAKVVAITDKGRKVYDDLKDVLNRVYD